MLGGNSYPIQKGTGFVFNENTPHETRNTGDVPRLLLGPMSETGFSVGAQALEIQQFTFDKQINLLMI